MVRIAGLPGAPGDYKLAVYLSEAGAEKERELRGAFPLVVRLAPGQ
jgi:hypothetical protein